MATVKLPTPYEPLVDTDGKIAEVWYRYFSESAISANSLSSALSAITTASTLTLATQTDEEASTSGTAIVTPSVQQYHPSAAKAWGLVRVTTTGTMTLSTGYNVASVTTVGGAGRLNVGFTVPFATSNYVVIPGIRAQSSVVTNLSVYVSTAGTATTGFTLDAYPSTGAFQDPAAWHFACYGDQ